MLKWVDIHRKEIRMHNNGTHADRDSAGALSPLVIPGAISVPPTSISKGIYRACNVLRIRVSRSRHTIQEQDFEAELVK